MKIGIDLQALQTQNSKNRGIGRYVRSTLEHLIQQPDRYWLYANQTLPLPEIDRDRVPYTCINYPTIGSSDVNNLLARTTLSSADIDAVFIPSPMEYLDATIPNLTNFHKKVFVICYDLIPLIFPERYLSDRNIQSIYLHRLENIKNADFIFAISEATRQDTIKYLNKSPDRVLNISGGISNFFCPILKQEHQTWATVFANKFGIHKKFILYTGGEDWRKNIEGLVQAFAILPTNLKDSYQLVIACKVSDPFIDKITSLSKKLGIDRSLVLTNYITDEELRALYSTCALFVFPSFYEGFGLPLLEAIACGAPAIASNNSSLPEIIGDPNLLFDPHSSADIANTIAKVLSNPDDLSRLSAAGLQQATKFTWESVANKISNVFAECQPLSRCSISFNRVELGEDIQPNLAFFSPFKPVRSGIADYSYDLLPSLSTHFQIDAYYDEYCSPDLEKNANLLAGNDFDRELENKQYEAIIYQMGNSSYHSYMYSKLMQYSGISVLHDYYLGGLIDYMEHHHPESGITLFNELVYNYGRDRAVELHQLVKQGKLNIHLELPELKIHLNRRIFTRSLGVILHSKWAFESAVESYSDDNDCIVHIPQLVPKYIAKNRSPIDVRQKFDIPHDSSIVSTFGFVSTTKRPLSILSAFKQYLSNYPRAVLIFVGGTDYMGLNIDREIAKLGLQNHVKITGYIDMEDFYQYIEISDICLNLRFPFKGESSASLLRILSVGKPTVVTNIGSFADFPDDIVLKIPQPNQCDEVAEILKALTLLTENIELKNSLSARASAYIDREHSPVGCAALYADFIERVMRSPQAQQKMLADYVGRSASKLAIAERDKVLTNFAKVIDRNFV